MKSRRYVATSNLLGGGPGDIQTADTLRAFARVCEDTFGGEPFKLSVQYDATSLANRLIATEPTEEDM